MRLALTLVLALPAQAESYLSMQERRPDLFHPDTGMRIARQRAPTPEDIPGPARTVDAVEARRMIEAGALALDVAAAAQSRYDELDGTWLVSEERLSLPGAVWLPEVGRGVLDERMQAYLARNLPGAPSDIVVFCIADCWMSWNAAQRVAALGHAVGWFRLGTDGWSEMGWPLERVDPVPVDLR